MNWTKGPKDVWTCRAGPFAVTVQPKGDGRFDWQIVKDGALNPTATGIANSLGAAKTTTEQFVKRSGG